GDAYKPGSLLGKPFGQQASESETTGVVDVVRFLRLVAQVESLRLGRIQQHISLLHRSSQRFLLVVAPVFTRRAFTDEIVVKLVAPFKTFGIHSYRRPDAFKSLARV